MEAITTERVHRPVGFAGAFVRQSELLWTSRRPILLMVALLGGLLLSGDPWVDDPKARLLTLWPVWLSLIGPFWGFAVFHNEGPSSRLYHWSQPVGRSVHSLARLAAGVAWLWLIFGVFIGVGWIIAAADGDAWQLTEIGFGGWLNFFTGPLLGYLAVSILTVASDYPIRWFFGLLLLFPLLLQILDDWLGLRSVTNVLIEPLENEDWGLGMTMIGKLGTEIQDLERAIRPSLAQGYRQASVVADWWIATPLWILGLAAMVTFLATRHPDTLPRIRRSG
jgi:hypothetical protein